MFATAAMGQASGTHQSVEAGLLEEVSSEYVRNQRMVFLGANSRPYGMAGCSWTWTYYIECHAAMPDVWCSSIVEGFT